MDKKIKNELSLSKAAKRGIRIGLAIFLGVSLGFCIYLYSNTRTTVRAQAIRSLTNICQLNEDSITRAFQNREKLLRTISALLTKRDLYEPEVVLDVLDDFADSYECYHMGVLDDSFKLYRTNGSVVDVSGMELTELIWDTESHITSSYYPSDSDDFMVNMFSYPVFEDGELRCVIVASYYSKDLVKRMNINSLKGKGFTFLLNEQSEVVIFPQQYENEEYNQLMEYIDDNPEIMPGENGDTYFNYNGDSYYAHFEKLGFNDWYMMTCAREKDVFAEARVITRNAFAALGLLWLVIGISLCVIYHSISHSREKLRRTVFYDHLLGIGNENALELYFRELPPEKLYNMYLVVFDVDKFKEFNYLYGDENSDRLLQYIVRIFKEEVPDVCMFRYKSDYFITLDPSRNEEELAVNVKKTQDRFALDRKLGYIQPFDTSGGVRKIEKGVPLRQLISDAMIAKDTIKGNHLLHHAFYDEKLRLEQMKYMEMESIFADALRNKQFHVYYQPKYDMRTGEIIGAEALTRWIKPDGTIISPGEFIPCFETSRQIILLDEAMLMEVCQQMQKMQADGLEVKPVSVNLSRVHLKHPGILSKIAAIIKSSGIDPAMLSFEITESALLEESIPLKSIVDRFHKLGCKVDMDDYGVGASNPNNLAFNNFDVVKLDKSFVDGIGSEHVEDVIEVIISLTKKWGIGILAEGVEEKYQADRLVEMGCFASQGFYYSRPVPESEYRKLLKEN